MKILFKGGTIVRDDKSIKADLLVEDEKIIEISKRIKTKADKVVDVKDKLLFPGFIDAHTHLDLHVAGTVTADNFDTGTKAAVIGGTTTVIDFGTQYHGESLKEALKNWEDKASTGTHCDYSFHMSISDWNENVKAEIQDMIDAGITSFKLYLTYPDMMLSDHDMYEVIKALWEKKCFAGVHCENAGVIDALREYELKMHNTQPKFHYLTRPDSAEAEAVNRLLFISKEANAPVMVVHTTCIKALDEIRKARKKGQMVFCETCPQYLILDHRKLDNEDFDEASKFVCAPPLRNTEDKEELWKAIKNGEVDIISTDHCSFDLEQRRMGKDDFTKIPGGLAGIEHRGMLIFSEGVSKGRITKEKMAEVLSYNPSKLFGISDRKGRLDKGMDADIVVINPKKERTISVSNSHYNIDYSCYEGIKLQGIIDEVYLRGTLVAKDNELIESNKGTFLKRNLMDYDNR